MKHALLLSLAFLLVAVPVSAQPAAPPVGTWAQLQNTVLYPAIPSQAKSEASGGTPELWSPQSLFAYSGGDIGQLPGSSAWGFLIWGGGHAATADNSLYWLPFDGSGPRRLMGPYLAPDHQYKYDNPWETYIGGAPKSRHTYSSLVYAPRLHTMFVYGGSLNTGSGGGTNVTRMFDLSQTYAQAMARADMGWVQKAGAPAGSVASSSGWDPKACKLITRAYNFLGAYDPKADKWERWSGVSGGSDFAASVAVDAAGRRMYVLGDRLAEVIDLDARSVTPISDPWATPIKGIQGPGIGWHERSRQIVAWLGGNDLMLIDPKTKTSRTVRMGGAQVSPAFSSGTFGRFRVIPGTDLVVLVNSVTENVFIGSVPFDARSGSLHETLPPGPGIVKVADPAPPPAPAGPTPAPLPAVADMPTRTWIERPLGGFDGIGKSYMPTGGKHGRTFYRPGLRQMVFAGGDWKTLQPNDGNFVGSEIWALDVASDTWTQLRPFCVPKTVQPGRPDNVVWAYDSKRDRGLMAPGFYGISQKADSGCGAIEAWGGYAFDFSTRQFTGPDGAAGLPAPPAGDGGQGWGGDEGASWGVYDPVNDELVRVRNGMRLERLNLASKTWRTQGLSDPGGTTPHRSQQVIDVKGRAVLFLAPWHKPPSLIRVSLKDGSVTVVPLPPQYHLPDGGGTEDYLVFDTIHRVLLIPNNLGMGQTPIQGLGIYHVDTGQWEWEAVPPVVVGSVWGFDEATGAMVGIGKRYPPFAYFLYKYDPHAPAPPRAATRRWMPATEIPTRRQP